MAALPLLLLCAAGGRPWRSSTAGIHRFGLWANAETAAFNSTPGNVSQLDFIWSLEFDELPKFRPAMPDAVLSKYVAFSLNNQYPRDGVDISSNLSWWQEHHPSWVLYRCDRKTPATYWGNGVPLDLTNPEVLAWQLHAPASENPTSVQAILEAGFDSISLDVFGTGNYGLACGVFDKGGAWKQLYSACPANGTWGGCPVSTKDPAYERMALDWIAAFYKGIAGRLRFIINFSSEPGADLRPCPTCLPSSLAWNASTTFFLGNHSDGALSEGGFTDFGSNVTTGAEWVNRLQHMRHLQKHGKYFADVSYWGPLNVRSKQPAPVTEAALEYIIASWLLGNEGLSSVFVRSMPSLVSVHDTCRASLPDKHLRLRWGRTIVRRTRAYLRGGRGTCWTTRSSLRALANRWAARSREARAGNGTSPERWWF